MSLAAPFDDGSVEWVFLDAYSTILQEDWTLLNEACREMERSVRGRATGEEIGAWWEERFHALCESSNADRFVAQRPIVARSLADTARHFRAEMDQAAWVEALHAYAARPVLHHDTRAFLSSVDTRVCLVSNIDQDDIESALASVDIRLDEVVSSEAARSYKPDGGIFREALRRTKATPERVLHVGDSYRADVVGARGAGLRVAWVNRRQRAIPEGATALPDAEVTSLADLIAW